LPSEKTAVKLPLVSQWVCLKKIREVEMKKLIISCVAVQLSSIVLAGLPSANVFAADFEIVQSVPLETNLSIPGIRETQQVWLEMIAKAQKTIDLEQFYISNQDGESLAPVIQAIEQAAQRGVHVRLLADQKFYKTYPDTIDEIGKTAGCEAKLIDFSSYGGIQHAKYFVVDSQEAFVGSQNFDWRALSHIHEVGVRVTDVKVNSDLELIFEKDWAAGQSPQGEPVFSAPNPLLAALSATRSMNLADDSDLFVVASPAQANPSGIPDSLSNVTKLMDSAANTIRIQVMEYTTRTYGADDMEQSAGWKNLDNNIRAAASRGVHVQLLVDVSALKSGKADLQALAKVSNVEVRTVTIPQWSGGKIDFARLIHAKYMTIDTGTSWVGSENWSESYFEKTRDVGLVINSSAANAQLNQIFSQIWQSAYTSKLQ
jgi:phosphatidylserine/phosphatidylglycerophosphate/cardiolipin synthase-like enzyme